MMPLNTPELSIQIQHSTSIEEASQAFMLELEDWILQCMDTYAVAPATDVHDQANYTLSWEPYYRITQDPKVYSFLCALRDKITEHFTQSGQWYHGYWRKQEVHHGTEHFELFLGMMHRIAPDDAETITRLIDAAEHIGNWVADIPAWFDWETGLFHSMYLGTEEIGYQPGMDINMPDHIRLVNVALLAYQATKEQRFLELAMQHGYAWVRGFEQIQAIPAALGSKGAINTLTAESHSVYKQFAGQSPELIHEWDVAENLLASGAVQAFLTLSSFTQDSGFTEIVSSLIDVLIQALPDPDAGAAAHAIRLYRNQTQDVHYDNQIIRQMEELMETPVEQLGVIPFVNRKSRASGIGKRIDTPIWFENGEIRTMHPITLGLAAEISQNEEWACHAMDMALAYFRLARQVFPDGRDHGCSARSIHAIGAGHGRENQAGMVTGVFAPLCYTNRMGG